MNNVVPCAPEKTAGDIDPMKTIIPLILTLLFTPLAFAAQAQQPVLQRTNHFSWNAINAGISDQHYENGGYSSDRTLFSANASYGVAEHFNIVGGVGYSAKGGDTVYDLNAGLGYHLSLIDNLDLFGDVRGIYRHDSYDYSCWSTRLGRLATCNAANQDTGYKIRAGARFRVSKALEVRAGAYHASVSSTVSGLFGSALYHLNTQWGFGANLAADNNHTISVGVFAHLNY